MIVGTRSVRRYFSSVIRRLARWSRQSMLSCHCDCSCREHWLHHRSTLRLRRPSPTSSCLRCVLVTHTTLLTVTWVHVSGAFMLHTRDCWPSPEFMSQVRSCYTHETAYRHLSSCYTHDTADCHLTKYELLRWLVETPLRDFAHYRLSGGSRIFTTCQELTLWHVSTCQEVSSWHVVNILLPPDSR